MNIEPQDPAQIIEEAIGQQSNLYNELIGVFYDPLQRALEPRNNQAIQNLRNQWSGGNPPEQDRFAMEIQTLRDTVEGLRGDPNVQNQVAELDARVTQLESMHEEITTDLLPANQNQQLNNMLNGGRRKKRRSTRKKRTQRRKSKKRRQQQRR